MSNLFVWNIYEKSFTPYWAKLAPKHQVHRHVIQRKPSRVSSFFQDSRMKIIIRFIRSQLIKRPYLYYFFVMLFACGTEYTVRRTFISLYCLKNHERSLAFAQEAEKNYLEERKRTHPEEFEDEEEEEVEAEASEEGKEEEE